MTSETVRHCANIIPYRMVLPGDFVCPDPESRTEGMLQAKTIYCAATFLTGAMYSSIPAVSSSTSLAT